MNGNGRGKRNSQLHGLKTKIELDWDEIRRRIAAASASLDASDETAPEIVEEIWARRAERLAQVPAKGDEGEHIQLALLRLGREVYGVDVQHIFDIRPVEHITRVPRVPDWVAGVVNLRGRVFSVVDLQRFLGLPEDVSAAERTDATPARYLAVVETPQMELALLADEVLPMETVAISQIQEAAGAVRGIRPEYLRGISGRSDGQSIVILDLAALLADEGLVVREEIV